MEYQQDIRLFV